MDRIIERVLGTRDVQELRRQALVGVHGEILEIGTGTGLNLRALPPSVRSMTAVTRDTDLHPLATRRARDSGISVRHLKGSAERLPCADGIFDTVVSTFLFCSLRDPDAAARECARVLRRNGRVVFLEHVRGATSLRRLGQRILDLPSRAVLCGCSLLRDTPAILAAAGLKLEKVEHIEVPTLPWSHRYLARGVATCRL